MPELNAMLVAHTVQTGAYLDHQRRCCVVVRVKENKVHLVHFRDSTVQLETSFKEKFLVDYPIQLYQYPARRALRMFARYVRDGFKCTEEARTVINAILKEQS